MGLAEHMNHTLLDKVWCMLSNAGLCRAFLAEVVTYARHINNRLLVAANEGKTPMEVCSEKLATDYYVLHVFDC